MKREVPCENCGAVECPMVFANDPWCSDKCRKELKAKEPKK